MFLAPAEQAQESRAAYQCDPQPAKRGHRQERESRQRLKGRNDPLEDAGIDTGTDAHSAPASDLYLEQALMRHARRYPRHVRRRRWQRHDGSEGCGRWPWGRNWGGRKLLLPTEQQARLQSMTARNGRDIAMTQSSFSDDRPLLLIGSDPARLCNDIEVPRPIPRHTHGTVS